MSLNDPDSFAKFMGEMNFEIIPLDVGVKNKKATTYWQKQRQTHSLPFEYAQPVTLLLYQKNKAIVMQGDKRVPGMAMRSPTTKAFGFPRARSTRGVYDIWRKRALEFCDEVPNVQEDKRYIFTVMVFPALLESGELKKPDDAYIYQEQDITHMLSAATEMHEMFFSDEPVRPSAEEMFGQQMRDEGVKPRKP